MGRLIIDGVDFTDLMRGSEVARLFRVNPRTVIRWAEQGHLASIRTAGGRRRFSRVQVEALLRQETTAPQPGGQR